MREWSTVKPSSKGEGSKLWGVRLTERDHELLAELRGRSGMSFTELRDGLSITAKSYIGTVNLEHVRVVITPKIQIQNLMRLVAYAFDLSDLTLTDTSTSFAADEEGMIDLLGLSLLQAVERIARGGLLPNYQTQNEDLSTLRGRLDMRYLATHPRRSTLRCVYDDLTVDHRLNRVLAAGLRFAANVMQSRELRLELARSADRLFGDLTRISLGSDTLRSTLEALDRRSSHYRTAVILIGLIYQGARLGDHERAGDVPLASFLLNMNLLFERFLERYLREHAPAGIEVQAQDIRDNVFFYTENDNGWRSPTIRPDFVFRRNREVIAVADAKYKNRHEHPPNSAELYQLTAYGLSYAMQEPREVILLHPVSLDDSKASTTLLFAPPSSTQHVRIRLEGVPLDRILDGSIEWWPSLGSKKPNQTILKSSRAGSLPTY